MSQERTTYPPLVAHGPDNKGATVVVASYSFMFITIIFGLLRTWSSYVHKRDLREDDIAFFLAALLIVPETVLTERAAMQGLGQHFSNVATSKLAQYYKYIYATQILGIIIQSLAKFSVVLMVKRIGTELSTRKSTLLLNIVIAIWALFSVFTIAFQCGIPRPWEFTTEKCAADGRLYYVVVVGTIIIDGVLACYFIPILWKLQTKRSSRILISSLFASRLVVCAVSIPYLAFFPKYLSSDDKTWYNTNVQTLHQVVINLSVITAGIPSVSRFFSDLQTGRLAFSNAEIEMTTGHSKMRSPDNSKINHSQTSARFGRGQRSTRDKDNLSLTQSNATVLDNSPDLRLRPDGTTRYVTHVVGGRSGGVGSERDAGERKANSGVGTKSDDDISDDKSTSSLTKHGVYQQRDFEMHVEYDHPDAESR